MPSSPRKKGYLKPKEVAALLRVEPGTIRSWAQAGKLRASTTPGGHRRFSYLDVEQFARQHNIALPRMPGEFIRVLVVDDDKRVARSLKRYIGAADENAEVEMAHDGFTAGQMVEKFDPNVIVMDLVMPGVDGFQLCKSLKNDPATADIRIIAITGDANDAAVARIVRLGAEVCLPKPIRRETLIEVVGL